MTNLNLIKRYLVFISGLYFLAMGIVLIVHSGLGTTPISSLNYVCSINTPLTLGTWTLLTNLIMIALQLWLARAPYGGRKDVAEILLQIPLSFVFSAFIDINMQLMQHVTPQNYAMSAVLLLMGCLSQSVGVVLEIKPRVAMMSAEGLVKYIARRRQKEFGHVKVGVDITLVALAATTSLLFSHRIEGIREGSVVTACLTGFIVSFLNRHIMTRRMLYRVIPILAR